MSTLKKRLKPRRGNGGQRRQGNDATVCPKHVMEQGGQTAGRRRALMVRESVAWIAWIVQGRDRPGAPSHRRPAWRGRLASSGVSCGCGGSSEQGHGVQAVVGLDMRDLDWFVRAILPCSWRAHRAGGSRLGPPPAPPARPTMMLNRDLIVPCVSCVSGVVRKQLDLKGKARHQCVRET